MDIQGKLRKIKNIKINKKIFFIIIAIIVMAISTCFTTIKIIQNNQKIKMLEKPLIAYETIIGENATDEYGGDKVQYNILITITSIDGIETVTYKKQNSEEEMTLYCKNKQQVGIDYTVKVGETYSFKIKQKGKDEITETINYEPPHIEGKYTIVNGVYSNEPDLTGYNEKNTRYLVLNENDKLTPSNWINTEKPSNWYDYNNSKWANIYVESKGLDTYYTWIPRYCYKIDTEQNERTDVKFIDIYNNYKDGLGNTKTWEELKSEGYKIPEAFIFNGTKLPGYWAMKYTCRRYNNTFYNKLQYVSIYWKNRNK